MVEKTHVPTLDDFNFGDIVGDKFTDLKGTVVGKCMYFNGCNKIGIQPREIHDGKTVGYEWLDVQQAVLLKTADEVFEPAAVGGPMSTPPRS